VAGGRQGGVSAGTDHRRTTTRRGREQGGRAGHPQPGLHPAQLRPRCSSGV
jgi:hypothetical protein